MLELTRRPHIRKRRAVKRVKKSDSLPWRKLFKEYKDSEISGITLRGARVKENVTQKELSNRAGIPQGHISAMENGKRQIGKKIAQKLGKALDVNYKVFL
jgi:ribosome-binding protein aMBF1 (putative translation factor)